MDDEKVFFYFKIQFKEINYEGNLNTKTDEL